MLSHQSDCSGKVIVLCIITNSQLANFLAAKQTLLVADNVINTYNYPNLLTAICKLAPVFVVKVSRPYFSTRPQGTREKFGVWGRDYSEDSQWREGLLALVMFGHTPRLAPSLAHASRQETFW